MNEPYIDSDFLRSRPEIFFTHSWPVDISIWELGNSEELGHRLDSIIDAGRVSLNMGREATNGSFDECLTQVLSPQHECLSFSFPQRRSKSLKFHWNISFRDVKKGVNWAVEIVMNPFVAFRERNVCNLSEGQ